MYAEHKDLLHNQLMLSAQNLVNFVASVTEYICQSFLWQCLHPDFCTPSSRYHHGGLWQLLVEQWGVVEGVEGPQPAPSQRGLAP